jgi:hypothetical protein
MMVNARLSRASSVRPSGIQSARASRSRGLALSAKDRAKGDRKHHWTPSRFTDGKTYEHDVIRLSGEVVKRKKKLSKKYYGTSHVLSTRFGASGAISIYHRKPKPISRKR